MIRIKKMDILWTYVAKFFLFGVNIILLPMIMAYLSDTELGLWYVFASISQIVNLFDFGFNATISRHMTYAWSGAKNLQKTSVGDYEESENPNTYLMSQVIATCKAVYMTVSVIALFGMSTLGTWYIYEVLDKTLTRTLALSWLVYILAVCLNLLYGYWTSLLHGIGAVSEKNKLSIYSKVIQIILAYILLSQGLGLLGFVISYAVSGIALRVIGKIYFNKRTAGLILNEHMKLVTIQSCFHTIWATAWKDGVVMLAQYLSTQANTLVCAYFIGLSTTSSYGIITQVASIIGSLASAYYSAYQPQYSNLCLRRDQNGLRTLTCKSVFIYQIIFGVMTMGFLSVGIPLLKWIRPTMEINIIMILGVYLFYFLYNQHSLFCSMIASTNQIPYYKSFIITAVCSIILSVTMADAFKMKIWGLILAQLIVNAAYNNWYWPKFIMREQNIKFFDIYSLGYKTLKSEFGSLKKLI